MRSPTKYPISTQRPFRCLQTPAAVKTAPAVGAAAVVDAVEQVVDAVETAPAVGTAAVADAVDQVVGAVEPASGRVPH